MGLGTVGGRRRTFNEICFGASRTGAGKRYARGGSGGTHCENERLHDVSAYLKLLQVDVSKGPIEAACLRSFLIVGLGQPEGAPVQRWGTCARARDI